MQKKSKGFSLSHKEIQTEVFKRLKKYDDLNFFEQFAMFMGKSQILEIGLKNLLTSKFGYDPKKIEKWTLGHTKVQLKKCGIRGDYIELLQSVVAYRNYIAHEFLANQAIVENLLKNCFFHSEYNKLYNGIFELEQIMFLSEMCQKYDAWM